MPREPTPSIPEAVLERCEIFDEIASGGMAALVTRSAAAEPSEADALYDQGLEQMMAENYEQGCPALEKSRALEPFPIPVRTLDALHLASLIFLLERSQEITLATYDRRMQEAARALGLSIFEL